MPEITEKMIAIVCLTVLGVSALFTVGDPTAIVTGVVGAIGGFTTSELLNLNKQP